MHKALYARLFPTTPIEAPEEAPVVTYTDPTAWMTPQERAFHTFGGVTR